MAQLTRSIKDRLIVGLLGIVLLSACQHKSRTFELSFANDFRGAFTFEVAPNGIAVDGDALKFAVPPNGVIHVQSLNFLHEWRHRRATRPNGDEIPEFNDEPYNAHKIGIRVVYEDDKKFVFMVGIQADCDALRRLGSKSGERGK